MILRRRRRSRASWAGRSAIPARRGCMAAGWNNTDRRRLYADGGPARPGDRRASAALPPLGFARRQRHRSPQGSGSPAPATGSIPWRAASAPSIRSWSREDGTIEGSNTDAFGFIANARQCAPARWCADCGPAGGARRRRCRPCDRRGAADAGVPEIRLVNRTRARAEAARRRIRRPRARAMPGRSGDAALEGAACSSTPRPWAWPGTGASTRSASPAERRRGQRHRLCAAGNAAAGGGAAPRQSRRRRSRHAAAPGAAGLRGLVRPSMPEVTPELRRFVLAGLCRLATP